MKAAVFAYSRRGCETARRLLALLGGDCEGYTLERFGYSDFQPLEKPSETFYGKLFHEKDALIFIGAAGIAVRQIAPHVKDKRSDPAVLVVDELGQYVIPLLSGHIGGANALSARLAEGLGAAAILTTATDINGRFSVDSWAAERGYLIGSMALAKAVSAEILERDVPFWSDAPILGALPAGLVRKESGKLGIFVSYRAVSPFERTLQLIPQVLHLGIGCRRGTEKETIKAAVEKVLRDNGLDARAIKAVASIDLKANEAGLLDFCTDAGIPVHFYSAAELQAVEGDFSASSFVQQVTGVDNVCERAALLGAERLLLGKTAQNGVTVAVAVEQWEVRFE